ncbi:hypothetical protein MRB53_004215 [Persea americana]|nr:hypothetical protein MRB53_004215 [Persea americana]
MLSSSSSSNFFWGVPFFFGIAPEPCQNLVVPPERTRVRSLSLMRLAVLPDLLMWPYSRPRRKELGRL